MSLVDHRPGTTSPFIPGTYLQYAWDSVSLTNFLACPRRYQLTHIEGWVPNGGASAIALTFGIAFHKAMEFYHEAKAAGADHDKAVAVTCAQLLTLPEVIALPTAGDLAEEAASTPEDDDGITARNSKVRTRYHLFRAVVWYLDHYQRDPATTIILPSGKPAVEYSFRVEFPIQAPEGFGNYILAGHIDRGVEFNNALYVLDYKTTKSLSSQFFSAWALSHQLTGYTFAGGIVFDRPVAGAIVDGIAVQVGGVQFGRAPSPRTKSQINEYIETVRFVTGLAQDFANWLAANPGYEYPMNTSSCYFCGFKEICRQPPEFRRKYLAMHFHQEHPWNPLENR